MDNQLNSIGTSIFTLGILIVIYKYIPNILGIFEDTLKGVFK